MKELEEKLNKAQSDINVYVRALELKAEEFERAASAMGIDIKASLLYDVGFQRENTMKCKRELRDSENRGKALMCSMAETEEKCQALELRCASLQHKLSDLQSQNTE